MSYMASEGLNWVVSIVDVGSFAGMITGLLAGIYGQSRIYFVTLAEFTYFCWMAWIFGFVVRKFYLGKKCILVGSGVKKTATHNRFSGPPTLVQTHVDVVRGECANKNSSKEHLVVVVLHSRISENMGRSLIFFCGEGGNMFFFLNAMISFES